jgi:hypothetical protein
MKDVAVFMAVLVVGYIVSMAVLYAAFRIFFSVTVEKEGSALKNVHLENGNAVMKAYRDVRSNRPGMRLHKIKLAHG